MLFLLIFYIVFLLGYIIFSGIAVYHLNRFGYVGDLTRPIIVIYLLLSVAIIIASIIFISSLSWPRELSF